MTVKPGRLEERPQAIAEILQERSLTLGRRNEHRSRSGGGADAGGTTTA